MFDQLEKALEYGQNLGASYVELRGESGFVEYIQMDDGRVNALTQRLERGVAIRVLADGAWGFVSTGEMNTLTESVENAYKMAKAAAKTRHERIELIDVKTHEEVIKSKGERDPRYVPIEEKIQYMTSITEIVRNY
ncbi:MAG: PmbA/TldA family metallopeptidase, partial [Candidatus Thorarchaeota archaeon]